MPPISIMIKPASSTCNMRCKYCFYNDGGEPLLAGKAFFRATLNLISRANIKNSPVFLGIQTNGTLIDDEWCEIFKTGDFLVGLSLDGDETANVNRVDKDGNPTFQKVVAAAKLLQKHDVNFNILTVLTKDVAMRIGKIYPERSKTPIFTLTKKAIPCFYCRRSRCTRKIWQTAITRRYASLTTSCDLLTSSAPNSAV